MTTSFFAKAALVLLTLTATTFAQAQIIPQDRYEEIIEMQKEVETIVNKIGDLQEEVGHAITLDLQDEEDLGKYSRGLVKAIGEKLDMTVGLQNELFAIGIQIQKQDDSSVDSYNKAHELLKQARKNLADSKKLATGN